MQTLLKFFVCGILSAFILPPFFIFPLGFIAFPFFYILVTNKDFLNKTKFFQFLCGFFYGLGLNIIAFIWIKEPFLIYKETTEFFYISYLLVFYCSIYYGFCTFVLGFIKNYFAKLLLIPALFVVCEFLIGNIGYGFPWLTFSLVYSSNIFMINFVYFLGTYGLSFFSILIFLLPINIFIVLYKKNNNLLKVYLSIILTSVFVFSLLVIIRIYDFKLTDKNSLNITLVQLNLSLLNKNHNFSQQNTLKNIENIIKKSKSELIIFSENDFPYMVKNLNQLEFIQDIIHKNQTVLIGGTRKKDLKYFNTLFFVQKNKIQEYDKIKLVPFGEFLPLRKYLTFFDIIVGQNDYSIGKNIINIINLNGLRIIPIICYEIIFINELISKDNFDNKLIVNVTNDSWFGKLSGPYQHFYIARTKSVELNKKLVRVSNNGVSAITNEIGSIISYIPLNKNKTLTTKINNPVSLYNLTYYHNLIFILLIFIILFALIVNFKNNE